MDCKKDKIKVRLIELDETDKYGGYVIGQQLFLKKDGYFFIDDRGWSFSEWNFELIEDQPTDTHYNNENGSLYLFVEHHSLNAWEFDIIKRITRCRKKGQFIEDLEKTKRVIDLYIKEYDTTTNR